MRRPGRLRSRLRKEGAGGAGMAQKPVHGNYSYRVRYDHAGNERLRSVRLQSVCARVGAPGRPFGAFPGSPAVGPLHFKPAGG